MLHLSGADIEKLKNALRILVAPLDYATADEWRRAANRELRELLHADSAGFLLPVEDGPFVYSEEHDPAELARYPDMPPPLLGNGQTIYQRLDEIKVGSLEQVYGDEFDERYLGSEYYNDYAGANGAHDTLSAILPLAETGLAGVHFWHSHPTRHKFGIREVALLEIAYPALHAGVMTHLTLARQRAQLLRVVDELGQALAVYDRAGTLLHQTPHMVAILAGNPDAPLLSHRIERARTVHAPHEVTGVRMRYRVRGFRYTPAGSDALTAVVVEPGSPVPKTDRALHERFGLTPAESRVAREIAEGKSNQLVAETLFISIHTAKRHTERVLQKLGVKSRAAVRARIHFP